MRKDFRKRLVNRISRLLSTRGYPRLWMAIIVLGTGSAGFLTSFLLLNIEMRSMGIRYAIAVVFAYIIFMILIYLWLRFSRRQNGPDIDMDLDGEVDIDRRPCQNKPDNGQEEDHGEIDMESDSNGSDMGDGVSGLDFGFDIEEGLVVLIIIAAVFSALVASIYVVYSAPVLFAEVLVDGALSAGLYRKLRKIERKNWVVSVFRKTWLPFFIVFVFFTVAGNVMQKYSPESDSIGDVWTYMIEKK